MRSISFAELVAPLTAEQRAVIALVYGQSWSLEQAADELRMSPTVVSRIVAQVYRHIAFVHFGGSELVPGSSEADKPSAGPNGDNEPP